MPYGMYISAEGAKAQTTRLETIANNLANVDTPGFKRDVTTFQARFAEAIDQGLDYPGSGSINDLGGGVAVASVLTDHSPGTMERTDIPTDLAIDGEGFFNVQKDGETYLTRAGNFRITASGQLVTPDGFQVLNDSGGPVVVDPAAGRWEVTRAGGIRQAGAITLLALTRPASLGDLAKVGQNLFRPLAPTEPILDVERLVRQGHLEGSSVNATSEMMEMIETLRAFEATTKLIQNQDHMISLLICRVLQG